MALAKSELFKYSHVEMANWAKSISHPARVMILQELAKTKDMTCKGLVEVLPLSQSTVSQHLKELSNAKLICRKSVGVESHYCVEWNSLERMFTVFNRMEEKVLPARPKRNCC